MTCHSLTVTDERGRSRDDDRAHEGTEAPGATTVVQAPDCRALIESLHWSATILGSRENWPERVRAVVDLTLDSPRAMSLGSGPDLTLIYNDAYAAILGSKHPSAMGQPPVHRVRGDLAARRRGPGPGTGAA